MSEEGLRSITVRKFKATTNSNHPYNVYDNLLKQNFQATAPNEVWMADITYIPTDEGWLYLAGIMDLYTRKIVGWHIDTRMTKELVIKALQRALNNEKPTGRVLHHSDRGSHMLRMTINSSYRNIIFKWACRDVVTVTTMLVSSDFIASSRKSVFIWIDSAREKKRNKPFLSTSNVSTTVKEVIPPLAMYRHVNWRLLTTLIREKQLPKFSYFSLFNVSLFLT